jgi:hypothetical protein
VGEVLGKMFAVERLEMGQAFAGAAQRFEHIQANGVQRAKVDDRFGQPERLAAGKKLPAVDTPRANRTADIGGFELAAGNELFGVNYHRDDDARRFSLSQIARLCQYVYTT